MTRVTFPDSGHSYSDDGSSDRDMLNGGHALWFLPMTGEAIAAYIKMAAWILEQRALKLGTNQDAANAANSAFDSLTSQRGAQAAADAARADAARVAIPFLAGNANKVLMVSADGLTMLWGGPFVRQGGGVGQTADKVFIGWSTAGRLKVTINSTDIGGLITDDILNSVTNSLLQTIATKANGQDTLNDLAQKANASDLNWTNQQLGTKASQDALNATNGAVAQKADTNWVAGNFANRSILDTNGVGAYNLRRDDEGYPAGAWKDIRQVIIGGDRLFSVYLIQRVG